MIVVKYILFALYMVALVKIMLKRNSRMLAYWFLPLFMFAWKMCSLIYLESGAFATELQKVTYKTGADYVFILLMSVFFGTGILLTPKSNRKQLSDTSSLLRITRVNRQIIRWAIRLHMIVLLYLYVNWVMTGTRIYPNLKEFYTASKLPLISQFGGTLSFFLLVVAGIDVFILKRDRIKCIWLYLLSMIYMVMAGSKFTGVFQYSIFFLIPAFVQYTLIRRIKFKDLFKARIIVPIVSLILLIVVLSLYHYRDSASGAFSFLFARVFDMQAGTLWGIHANIVDRGIQWFGDASQRSIELKGILTNINDMDASVGLCRVMTLTAPSYLVEAYLSNGIRLSGWFLVVSLLSLGYVGSFFLSILVGAIFARIVNCIDYALRDGNIIMLGIMIYEFCKAFDYIRIGNYTYLFSPMNICILLFVEFYLFLRRKKIRIRIIK